MHTEVCLGKARPVLPEAKIGVTWERATPEYKHRIDQPMSLSQLRGDSEGREACRAAVHVVAKSQPWRMTELPQDK